MHYLVSARLISERAAEFRDRLRDGSIRQQEPDGREIVDSMHRARVSPDETIRWSEVCYCPTPLEHERATVYDRYFRDLNTVEAEGDRSFEGERFLDYLNRIADSD